MAAQALPVIVGFGGINGAGRVSGHHAYSRLVYSALGAEERRRTRAALAQVMELDPADADESYILDHTLIRRIESGYFDTRAVSWNSAFNIHSDGQPLHFKVRQRQLPDPLPDGWTLLAQEDGFARVEISGSQKLYLPTTRVLEVSSASQLPSGFNPAALYPSRNHPRGLQMTIYAASDALGNLGIDWDSVCERLPPDMISVYAGSAMGQLDQKGTGGMLKARAMGQRVTSKYCALGFAEMPADFMNAYVLGTMGQTGASLGACASFNYNLRNGIEDIRSGKARVAVVGSAEAPIIPEVLDSYIAMGALATDKGLRALDGLGEDEEPDHRRACRPFAENCGFTVGESAQVVILFDDALAMELGATPYGAATEVFVNADGFKKSISGPGVGNYITMAKAAASMRAILGEDRLNTGGMVLAHGTGTPQNRTTESAILSRVASTFGIENWPVVALKAYLGHSLGAASADQLTAALGIWSRGLLPGITTIDEVAADVTQDNLLFSTTHIERDPGEQYYCIVNAKGFGGNNASAALLSPLSVKNMLQSRYSRSDWLKWQRANERVIECQVQYDQDMTAGKVNLTYLFDNGVLRDEDVTMSKDTLSLGESTLRLETSSYYEDMAF